MLSLLFTVCIYEQLALGLIFLIVSISFIEATSKLSIPDSISVSNITGCGLVFTAYRTFPGNFFWKKFGC